MLAERSGVPGWVLRNGDTTSEDHWRAALKASQTFKDVPLWIDPAGGITINDLAARARRMTSQRGLKLIIVDYLQLLKGTSTRGAGNRVQEVTEITVGLKALAKELEIPVIGLSQLSRQVEQREDKRPMLSDLRESGSIEQDADLVAFVFREQYYLERSQPDPSDADATLEWQDRMRACAGFAEVIIGKNRHGPVGTAVLKFNGDTTTFSDL
jgi:replicative DNA helicase